MNDFDPNAAALKDSGIFGLPTTIEQAKLVLIPVPWEATTSYGAGTAAGPQAIYDASKQIDLFDKELGNFYEAGIAMEDIANEISTWNQHARQLVLTVLSEEVDDAQMTAATTKVNAYSEQLNDFVYRNTKHWLAQGRYVGVVGGDHSVPFGAIKAHLEKYPNMSILHFDAHADLRNAFEGFEHSHASIMYNVISKTPLKRLVQVGIRDFCEDEMRFIQDNAHKITTFFDEDLVEQKLSGKTWATICDEIINNLSNEVYVSFDIDGLDPRFCPHTGTPVPGGLDFNEALFLLKKVVQSGRTVIGFDLNEVSPGVAAQALSDVADPAAEWDANVGARLLYKLCGWTLTSHRE